MQKKRLSAVQTCDVKIIGEQIKFKLISKNISLDDIDKYLFTTDIINKDEITILEMQEALKRDPFNITNPIDLINTSRYLIEDNNTLGFVDYNEKSKEKVSIVRSIFKNFVQHYVLFENEKELHDKIAEVMEQNQWKSSILDQLNKSRGNRRGSKSGQDTLQCTKNEFSDTFAYLDSSMLKNKEIDYLFYQIYRSSEDGNLNNISLQQFFDSFLDNNSTGGESGEK